MKLFLVYATFKRDKRFDKLDICYFCLSNLVCIFQVFLFNDYNLFICYINFMKILLNVLEVEIRENALFLCVL